MKVNLIYFRPTGKYAYTGEYDTEENKPLWEIWQEVEQFKKDGDLPGLIQGCNDFIIYVDVPKHEHRHPHLIL